MFTNDPEVSQIVAALKGATEATASNMATGAIQRLEPLAAAGNGAAAVALALILELGIGRDAEPARAKHWYDRAHDMASDQSWRDYLLFQSARLAIDLAEAADGRMAADNALRKLCDHGDVRAQLFLGLRYIEEPPESDKYHIGVRLLEHCAKLGIIVAGVTLARSAFRHRQFRRALGLWLRNLARLHLIIFDYRGDRLFLCRPVAHWMEFGVPGPPLQR